MMTAFCHAGGTPITLSQKKLATLSAQHLEMSCAKTITEAQAFIAGLLIIRSIPTLGVCRDQTIICSEAGVPSVDALRQLKL